MKHFFLSIFLLSVLFIPLVVTGEELAERLAGRIVLNVEEKGEAWYINPEDNRRYFLSRPSDAFQIMRELGVGIKEKEFQKIPQAGMPVQGDFPLAERLAGRIIIRVDHHGEAWYVDPTNEKKYYLGRPADAFRIMRERSLGISRLDLARIHKSGYDESLNEYSQYRYDRKVSTKYEEFSVDQVIIDLDAPRLKVMTVTANSSDCQDNCPVQSLGEYVVNNDGFAGINGSYFNADWSGSNYYFAPVYNTLLGRMINAKQLKYWTTGPIVAFDTENNFYYYRDSREFKSVEHFEESENAEIRAALAIVPD